MPRARPLPPLDELRVALGEHGVESAPETGDEEALRGLLSFALFLADNLKRIDFEGFSWDAPGFVAVDAKARIGVEYVRMARGAGLEETMRAALPRVAGQKALLAIDTHGTELLEFEALHALYGRVTLFQYPHKPQESADLRIDAARERGWVKTLKEHNLLPGRGIVVLDEHQGLLLRDPAFEALLGLLLLTRDGTIGLHWNPFVEADRNEPEMQYWLAWGEGTGQSSEWRQMLHVEASDEE
jgi:hypothetical protein